MQKERGPQRFVSTEGTQGKQRLRRFSLGEERRVDRTREEWHLDVQLQPQFSQGTVRVPVRAVGKEVAKEKWKQPEEVALEQGSRRALCPKRRRQGKPESPGSPAEPSQLLAAASPPVRRG